MYVRHGWDWRCRCWEGKLRGAKEGVYECSWVGCLCNVRDVLLACSVLRAQIRGYNGKKVDFDNECYGADSSKEVMMRPRERKRYFCEATANIVLKL